MWKYKDQDINTLEDIPEKHREALGFIYLIVHKPTGKRYIGKKLLQAAGTKTVKGVKRKIKKESDWKTYWSSSPTIKEMIAEDGGTQNFTREILNFCYSKSQLLYAEEYFLYLSNALLSENYLNSNIRSRIYRKWFESDKEFINLLRTGEENLCKTTQPPTHI